MSNFYRLPSDEKIEVRLLERMLEEGLMNSYKLFWFKGVFQEIIDGETVISFRRIVCRMIAAAWYPLAEFHLNFGAKDMLSDIVFLIKERFQLANGIKELELIEILRENTDKDIEKKIINLFNMVPYRLLSPFLNGEHIGQEDHMKNKIIAEMSNTRIDTFYRIDREHKYIEINSDWADYILKNQNIIYGWMSFKLVMFLQKRNPNVPGIPFKLEAPRERNLNPAKKFWTKASQEIELRDIYSGEILKRETSEGRGQSISIDHFIPWSFVLHDELWNLVPTFHGINSSKSDRLPDLDLYLEHFCKMQYQAVVAMLQYREFQKQLEDYLTLDRRLKLQFITEERGRCEFIQALKGAIEPLHQIAYHQGYQIWSYRELEYN